MPLPMQVISNIIPAKMVHHYCKSHYAQRSRNSIYMERNANINWNDCFFIALSIKKYKIRLE
jgi:hypothetical protein